MKIKKSIYKRYQETPKIHKTAHTKYKHQEHKLKGIVNSRFIGMNSPFHLSQKFSYVVLNAQIRRNIRIKYINNLKNPLLSINFKTIRNDTAKKKL